jgi:alkaline phosphatase D
VTPPPQDLSGGRSHVEAGGLDADRVYYFRFRAGKWISPAGRTRTAPARSARIRELKFAVVSCEEYHDGYFTAYRNLADEELDTSLSGRRSKSFGG